MQPRSIDSRAQPEQSARGASPIERCDAGACGLVDGEVEGLDAQRAQRRPLHDTMLRRVFTCGEHRSDSVSEEVPCTRKGKRMRRRGKGGGGALFTVEAHGFHEPDVAVGEVTRDPRRVIAARVHHVRVAPTVVQQCFGLAKLAPPQPHASRHSYMITSPASAVVSRNCLQRLMSSPCGLALGWKPCGCDAKKFATTSTESYKQATVSNREARTYVSLAWRR